MARTKLFVTVFKFKDKRFLMLMIKKIAVLPAAVDLDYVAVQLVRTPVLVVRKGG